MAHSCSHVLSRARSCLTRRRGRAGTRCVKVPHKSTAAMPSNQMLKPQSDSKLRVPSQRALVHHNPALASAASRFRNGRGPRIRKSIILHPPGAGPLGLICMLLRSATEFETRFAAYRVSEAPSTDAASHLHHEILGIGPERHSCVCSSGNLSALREFAASRTGLLVDSSTRRTSNRSGLSEATSLCLASPCCVCRPSSLRVLRLSPRHARQKPIVALWPSNQIPPSRNENSVCTLSS